MKVLDDETTKAQMSMGGSRSTNSKPNLELRAFQPHVLVVGRRPHVPTLEDKTGTFCSSSFKMIPVKGWYPGSKVLIGMMFRHHRGLNPVSGLPDTVLNHRSLQLLLLLLLLQLLLSNFGGSSLHRLAADCRLVLCLMT